jgi:hypothetical protein
MMLVAASTRVASSESASMAVSNISPGLFCRCHVGPFNTLRSRHTTACQSGASVSLAAFKSATVPPEVNVVVNSVTWVSILPGRFSEPLWLLHLTPHNRRLPRRTLRGVSPIQESMPSSLSRDPPWLVHVFVSMVHFPRFKSTAHPRNRAGMRRSLRSISARRSPAPLTGRTCPAFAPRLDLLNG